MGSASCESQPGCWSPFSLSIACSVLTAGSSKAMERRGEGVRDRLNLVGLAEIAQMAGVSKQVVANWRSRQRDFPEPISELKSGPVWALDDVRHWADGRGVALRGLATNADEKTGGPRTMAKTVAITNMKGGVGKSTVAANLAWYCAYYNNKKVLL